MAISTDLYPTLRDDILDGKLRDGLKLTEKVLCDKYKVSRTPVREALQKLKTDGLVNSIPNRGFFVTGLSKQDYKDMFTLRKIYEIQAIKWAIERITDEQFAELSEIFEFMEFYTMKKDIAKMLTININFHRKIYEASGNRMLKNLLSSYQDMLKHAEVPSQRRSGDYLQVVFEEHTKIFEAFKKRDVEAGITAMTRHMDNSKERYIAKIRK